MKIPGLTMRGCALTLAFIWLCLCPVPGFGFGKEANRIIGALADAHLTPVARKKVRALLGEEKTLASVASWADKRTSRRPHTRAWHRLPIPLKAEISDSLLLQGKEVDSFKALHNFVKCLKHAEVSNRQKAESLKWIINLMGDIHQPLQVAMDEHHKGMDIQIKFTDEAMSLHQFWESGLIRLSYKKPKTLSHEIMGGMRPVADSSLYASSGLIDWIKESHELGKTCYAIQGNQVKPGDTVTASEAYRKACLEALKQQLKKAGLRLAHLLNQTFSSRPIDDPFAYAWSRSSKVYHYRNCSGVKRIKPQNVVFSDLLPLNKTLHKKCPLLKKQ